MKIKLILSGLLVLLAQTACTQQTNTQTMKYNNIKLTYQSNNTTNKGLGDMNAPAIYIYRPFI